MRHCAATYLSLRSVQPDCLFCLQKAVSRRLFCFGMAPGTAHEDLRTVHCCRRHKFAIHHCCATLNILVQLTVKCSFYSKQRMHCCVSNATMVTRTRPNVTLHVHCLSCSVIMSRPILKLSQPIGTRVHFRRGKAART